MQAAALIREARRRAGLTQSELAERGATSQATVSLYERGRRSPSAATLERLLAATGHRLAATPATRQVRTPDSTALRRAGETLLDVLGLAAELPTSHAGTEPFPGLPQRSERGER